MKKYGFSFKRLSPAQLLVIWFLVLILIGTVLLLLPFSTTKGISLVDAVFTATSAACVTGLIVKDTPNDFTLFGQLVILILIQIGGIGIMAFSSLIAMILGKKLGLFSSLSLKEDLNFDRLGELKHLLYDVFKLTFIFEFIGGIILSIRFSQLSLKIPHNFSNIYLGFFHSISAFCNAGFSLFSDSLERFTGDWVINMVIMILIFFGGIGFFVIIDVIENKMKPKLFIKKSKKRMEFKKSRKSLSMLSFTYFRERGRISLHSKLVIWTSIILIFIGAIIIFFTEITHNNLFKNFDMSKKILISLFASVTSRTAGFNTLPVNMFTIPTVFLMIFLMFIGASPGSTGGGIKTSSIAVLLLATFAVVKGEKDINLYKHRISWEIVHKALALIIISLGIILIDTFILSLIENKSFLELLFEVTSAFGTVGLSLGITSDLSSIGKVIITITMLIGRLGPLTLAVSLSTAEPKVNLRFPQEDPIIG